MVDVDSIDPANTSWANYDPSSGTLTVLLCKAIPGSDFGDLSMISRLLAVDDSSKKKDYTPTIEVLDSKEENSEKNGNGSSDANAETSKDIMEPLRMDSGKIDLERERAILLDGMTSCFGYHMVVKNDFLQRKRIIGFFRKIRIQRLTNTLLIQHLQPRCLHIGLTASLICILATSDMHLLPFRTMKGMNLDLT